MNFLTSIVVALIVMGPISAIAEESIDHVGHDHETIQITSRGIHPDVVKIGSDDAVTWTNYSEHVAIVSFPEGIIKNMICNKPTNFRKDGNRFNSAPMRGLEFASVCQFKPGRYPYVVNLITLAPGSSAKSRLEGVLEVE